VISPSFASSPLSTDDDDGRRGGAGGGGCPLELYPVVLKVLLLLAGAENAKDAAATRPTALLKSGFEA
jgi:hypothetical protein